MAIADVDTLLNQVGSMSLEISSLLRKPRFWLLPLAALLLAGILALVLALRSLTGPMPITGADRVFEVQPGSSLTRVANTLHAQGYIASPLFFNLYGRWLGVSNSIQTGEYSLEPGLSAVGLLEKMVNGEQLQYRLTLVEGWTFERALQAIRRAPKLVTTLDDADRADIAGALDLPVPDPEGMLFPDTYFYTRGTTDLELLRRANERLQNVLNAAWQERLGALPFETPYEALILASIVEKESAVESERGYIAGVFVRRLELGMRLQSDPTVIYGIGEENFDGDIRSIDLQTQNPYNTYRVNGLPPTPIALAGRDSIVAALNPIQSDYLYFVSKGDGSHYFSSTLEEHNQAVRQYQLRQEVQ